MSKKTYFASQSLDVYLAAQSGVPFSFDYHKPRKNFFEDGHAAIVEQSIEFIEKFLSGENVINPGDIDKVSDLIDMVHHTSDKKLRLKMNQLYHKFEEKKAELNRRNENVKKFEDIKYVEKALYNKKTARALSPEELLAAKATLDNVQANGSQYQKLAQKLNSYALLKYSDLKNNDEFLPSNPVHQQLRDDFGLQHVRLSQTFSRQPVNMVAQPVIKKVEKISWLKKLKDNVKNRVEKISDWAEEKKDYLHYLYRRHEIKIAAGSFALLGVLFVKIMNQEPKAASYYPEQNHNTETKAPAPAQVQDTAQTVDFVQAAQALKKTETSAQETEQNKNGTVMETAINGDYYDTALEIHLKSKQKVLSLYHKIDSLAQSGKIKFADGTNAKRYAHAVTMYRLIRPNSAETKAFEKLFGGEKIDSGYLNNLVLKAGEKGTGVKPDNNNIRHSNFDAASKILQAKHMQNLRGAR